MRNKKKPRVRGQLEASWDRRLAGNEKGFLPVVGNPESLHHRKEELL